MAKPDKREINNLLVLGGSGPGADSGLSLLTYIRGLLWGHICRSYTVLWGPVSDKQLLSVFCAFCSLEGRQTEIEMAAAVAQALKTMAAPETVMMVMATASAGSGGGMKMPCHDDMNHGGMDHTGMDHGGMDHDMPGMKMCKMAMTLNSDYENLCILTETLMVTNKPQLVFAMTGIALFSLGYEYFKLFVDRMQARYSQYLKSNTVTENERVKYKVRLSAAYAFSVGYSFIIMLLFMSFNVWVMLAVCIGAGLGHYAFGGSSSTASLVCH